MTTHGIDTPPATQFLLALAQWIERRFPKPSQRRFESYMRGKPSRTGSIPAHRGLDN